MKIYQHRFAIEKMCKVLQVSRSGYYNWLGRKPSKRSLENKQVTARIRTIYEGSKRIYGSPKITAELSDQGYSISRPRVARIMRLEGMRSIINKKFRVCTTDSNHSLPIAGNHLKRNFSAVGPGKVWVSDITYVHTAQGWLFLTIILDLYDRKIIGWALSETMSAKDTVLAAMRMALVNRVINGQLVFHSDRGVQYASAEFRKALSGKPVLQSMSRKGDCWDNAVAESFFKIIKSELIYHHRFLTRHQAGLAIFEFIEVWYNRKRRHSVLGYCTPEAFGKKNNVYKKAA